MKILDSSNYKKTPWKNGQGFTRELYREDLGQSGDFLLRISQATITQDGPFSKFPGIDRILILLQGNGVRLQNNSSTSELLLPYQWLSFPGEASFQCHLIQGPCEDFNIMAKRDQKNALIEIKKLKQNETLHVEAEQTFLYIAEGKVKVLEQEVGYDQLICLNNEACLLNILHDAVIIKIDSKNH